MTEGDLRVSLGVGYSNLSRPVPSFFELKRDLCTNMQRGMTFADTSMHARSVIAELGARFLSPNCVVMLHGYSRVVVSMLQRAVAQVWTCVSRRAWL